MFVFLKRAWTCSTGFCWRWPPWRPHLAREMPRVPCRIASARHWRHRRCRTCGPLQVSDFATAANLQLSKRSCIWNFTRTDPNLCQINLSVLQVRYWLETLLKMLMTWAAAKGNVGAVAPARMERAKNVQLDLWCNRFLSWKSPNVSSAMMCLDSRTPKAEAVPIWNGKAFVVARGPKLKMTWLSKALGQAKHVVNVAEAVSTQLLSTWHLLKMHYTLVKLWMRHHNPPRHSDFANFTVFGQERLCYLNTFELFALHNVCFCHYFPKKTKPTIIHMSHIDYDIFANHSTPRSLKTRRLVTCWPICQGLRYRKSMTAAIWPSLDFTYWTTVGFKARWQSTMTRPFPVPACQCKIQWEALCPTWIFPCLWRVFHMERKSCFLMLGVWMTWIPVSEWRKSVLTQQHGTCNWILRSYRSLSCSATPSVPGSPWQPPEIFPLAKHWRNNLSRRSWNHRWPALLEHPPAIVRWKLVVSL